MNDGNESVESAKTLNRDYGLVEAEGRDENLKQFLAHIGKTIFVKIKQLTLKISLHLEGTQVIVVVQGTE